MTSSINRQGYNKSATVWRNHGEFCGLKPKCLTTWECDWLTSDSAQLGLRSSRGVWLLINNGDLVTVAQRDNTGHAADKALSVFRKRLCVALVWWAAVPVTHTEFLCWVYDVCCTWWGDEWWRSAISVSWQVRPIIVALIKQSPGYYGFLSERFTTGLTQIGCTKDLVRELVDFFQGGSYRKRKNTILEEAWKIENNTALTCKVFVCIVLLFAVSERLPPFLQETGASVICLNLIQILNPCCAPLSSTESCLYLSAPPPRLLLFALHAADQNPKVNYMIKRGEGEEA